MVDGRRISSRFTHVRTLHPLFTCASPCTTHFSHVCTHCTRRFRRKRAIFTCFALGEFRTWNVSSFRHSVLVLACTCNSAKLAGGELDKPCSKCVRLA